MSLWEIGSGNEGNIKCRGEQHISSSRKSKQAKEMTETGTVANRARRLSFLG